MCGRGFLVRRSFSEGGSPALPWISVVLLCVLFASHTNAEDLTTQKDAYLALLERYAQGDVDEAARAVLALEFGTASQVVRLAADERQAPTRTKRRLQLMLLVHTEAGLARAIPQQQFLIAGQMVDRLWRLPEPARASVRLLVRDWYLLVASQLATLGLIESLKQHLAGGLARFKDDPELLLARGAVHERDADTEGRRRSLQSARRDYQRAYVAQPDLLEARLRWGRVQGSLGEVVPAVSALSDVVSSGAPAYLRYLALTFRAELSERAGNTAAARDDRSEALGVLPRAQDPLADYRHGQAWLRDERLASFRLRGVAQ